MEVPTERGHVFAIIATKAMGSRGARPLADQLVATPVPQGRQEGRGGLHDSRAGQGSPAAVVKQIVDIQVPHGRRGRGGGLQGLRPGQNSTADVEQIVDIPARGCLQGFLPGQGSSSSRLLDSTDEGIHGVFRTFPWGENVRRYSASRVRECPPVPAHPSWALIKWLRPESLMRVGRTGLVTPCLQHMRLYGGCGGGRGVGERAEPGAVVQLCRSPWVSRLWTSLCSSATSSCSPMSLTRMRLRFSSSSECGTFLLCSRDVYAQCNLCRRPAIPRCWCSFGELSFSRRRLGEEGGSSSFRLGVGAHHTGDEPM